MNKKSITKSTWFSYLMISISAILYVLGLQVFMSVARILPAGLGAFALLPTVINKNLVPYFPIFYLVLNIPLLIFFFKKIKAKFLIRTSFFLIISSSFGAIFFIEDVKYFFQHLILKGTMTINELLDSVNGTDMAVSRLIWPMFILPALAGVIVGLAITLSWKYGGSTAGSDIVIYYFSTKKKKQVGTVSMIVSLIILFSTFGVLMALNESIRSTWISSIFGSFIYIGVSSLVVNLLYPKYSKVHIEIHSQKIKEISNWMKKNYIHSFRMECATSGYDDKTKDYIVTVMLLLETKDFVKNIKNIDPNIWISISKIEKIFGNFNTKFVD